MLRTPNCDGYCVGRLTESHVMEGLLYSCVRQRQTYDNPFSFICGLLSSNHVTSNDRISE